MTASPETTFRVLVTDWTFPDFSRYERELKGLNAELVFPKDGTLSAFLDEAPFADALIHEHLDLTPDVVRKLTRCRVIAHHGKGVDNIAVDVATESGILVANVTDASLHDVAEHVFALLLNVSRRIAIYDSAVRNGHWHVDVGQPVYRLRGRTLGLVGFGGIAQQVAARANGFGMKVIAYARRPDPTLAAEHNISFVDLDGIFSVSDVVSLHLPLTSETAGIASRVRLRSMKQSAILINISRGGLVDENELAEILAERSIFGAGLDVLAKEPPEPNNPLLQLDNAVLTPHCAWYSEEGCEDVESRTAREVFRVLSGEWPVSLVNPEVKSAYAHRWTKT
jgi:D-3-phosphoglycerate dehydrogenase